MPRHSRVRSGGAGEPSLGVLGVLGEVMHLLRETEAFLRAREVLARRRGRREEEEGAAEIVVEIEWE